MHRVSSRVEYILCTNLLLHCVTWRIIKPVGLLDKLEAGAEIVEDSTSETSTRFDAQLL
jgi:hypothetical protein